MGVMALALGVWVVAYLVAHRGLDAASQDMAAAAAVACLGFGLYVVIRRVRRGPQH